MKNIAKALSNAHMAMKPLLKDAENTHFKSQYATLHNVIETAKGAFSDNGLVCIETTHIEWTDGIPRPIQSLELVHVESGESIMTEMPLKVRDPQNPQQIGSAQTYCRRYLWTAIAGLAPEDDDGNKASLTEKPDPKPKAQKKTANMALMIELKDRLEQAGFDTTEKRLKWVQDNGAPDAKKPQDITDAQLNAMLDKLGGEK